MVHTSTASPAARCGARPPQSRLGHRLLGTEGEICALVSIPPVRAQTPQSWCNAVLGAGLGDGGRARRVRSKHYKSLADKWPCCKAGQKHCLLRFKGPAGGMTSSRAVMLWLGAAGVSSRQREKRCSEPARSSIRPKRVPCIPDGTQQAAGFITPAAPGIRPARLPLTASLEPGLDVVVEERNFLNSL
jgi:hypothetical protein